MWYFRHHARRWVRSLMKPMDPNAAKKWLIRVRIFYFATAISSFGVAYYVFKSNEDLFEKIKALDPSYAHRQARLKGEPGKVVIHRFTLGGDHQKFEYNNEDYIKDYEERKQMLNSQILKHPFSKT